MAHFITIIIIVEAYSSLEKWDAPEEYTGIINNNNNNNNNMVVT